MSIPSIVDSLSFAHYNIYTEFYSDIAAGFNFDFNSMSTYFMAQG